MSLIRHTPRGLSALDPFSGMESLLDNFFSPVRMRDLDNDLHMPSTDIRDTKTAYEVTAELPGMKKEDIKVSLDNGVLTISAENKSETEEKKEGQLIRRERRYGKFLRRFSLGPDVQEDKVDAKFEDGVLKLTIHKAAQKPAEAKRITIS
ncbi:Hsp20/alpha crystallin family protein [Pseudomonas sp. N040]|uniref:Hsp20/alpha crystallin family protein n=1 Tax=Pseudomonas sp. N040 TaxID=2785325 RepID=UPI0018A333BC|nr:Hsp20/alpha crystallin family protein [Pseudomonas sp. N040]MBF7731547.1 Hsp20/alpha crystallin family protein [Pseudomonas sp. N040]MBW7015191.1 Hsp20/alpha crystallin family protein [Pseudomonas sp. N040]